MVARSTGVTGAVRVAVSTPQKISFMYILALFIAVQFSMGAKPRQKDTTPGSPYPSAP